MEKKIFELPSPSFNMRASAASDPNDQRMHCFPASADRRAFSLDQLGHVFLLEADTSRVVMLPCLHKPKLEPISLYIPGAQLDLADLDGGGGTLFIMDRIAKPLPGSDHYRFEVEALVYRNPSSNFLSKSWECQLLPPPPCVGGEISSYGVVKCGFQICISVDGVGTYCLDTTKHTWIQVGKWTLPFQGKVEFKLWFGFSACKGRHFAAADLSAMDDSLHQPQLLYSWEEVNFEPPQGQGRWQQIQDPQFVNLGSGRFCIANFFLHTTTTSKTPIHNGGDESSSEQKKNVTVLTGVEFASAEFDDGIVRLGLVKHKSRCHKSSCTEDTITAVF